MDAIDRHNRYAMIQRVKVYWLHGVLEESLHGARLIDINLAYRPEAVSKKTNQPAWQTAVYDTPVPPGASISDLFNQAEGELLVLGEPGGGKTTLLLNLVSDLLHQAEQDELKPIPVVFSLGNWSAQETLETWLINELSSGYEVPHELGVTWIAHNQLILLLDGLDEVEQEQRAACVAAINQLRAQHPGVNLLITTRSQDYQQLAARLQLNEAIVLQPLTQSQIDLYLDSQGPQIAGLRTALQNDTGLRELAQTPLMLSIMTLAYVQQPLELTAVTHDRDANRKRLFDIYVERMVRYREGNQTYSPANTIRWLTWLAQMLVQHNRTILFLENMQPNWLPRPRQRGYADRLKLIIGLACIIIGLFCGALGMPVYGWQAPLVGGGIGILIAAWTALTGRFMVRFKANWYKIETVETLSWSWQWAWLGLLIGGIGGLIFGSLLTFSLNRLAGETAVPWWLLFSIWSSLGLSISLALMRSEVKMRTIPGEGLIYSRRHGLTVGVGTAGVTLFVSLLLTGVIAMFNIQINWLAAFPWLIGGALYLGLLSGLTYGGLAALQHWRLRTLFRQEGLLPEDPIHFWDYAAARSLLRKIGGGYTFIHALLLDYFRQLETQK